MYSVTYFHFLPCTVVFSRKINNLLDFITWPVSVFPKDDTVSLSGGGQGHEGVTGRWLHGLKVV